MKKQFLKKKGKKETLIFWGKFDPGRDNKVQVGFGGKTWIKIENLHVGIMKYYEVILQILLAGK